MAASGKATLETYRLGLRLLATRKQAKHGEWLAWLRQSRISQPTAWRYMRFATQVKTDPRWAWLRKQDRLVRALDAEARAYERTHGHPRDWTKRLGALATAAPVAAAPSGRTSPARRRR
jgi:hypothetical protein